MDIYAIINAVMWLGVYGAILIIGSSIVILTQSRKNHDKFEDLPLRQIEFDEFYDASDNISFDKIHENMK